MLKLKPLVCFKGPQTYSDDHFLLGISSRHPLNTDPSKHNGGTIFGGGDY